MQGIGVSTPEAAAVAEATVGLASDMHMPNGMMFTIGMWSLMLAPGGPSTFTRLTGSTTRLDGAIPNEHMRIAPWVTSGTGTTTPPRDSIAAGDPAGRRPSRD